MNNKFIMGTHLLICLLLPSGQTLAQEKQKTQLDSEPISSEKEGKKVELVCKLDNGANDVRYTIDLEAKRLYHTAMLENGMGGLPINVSDREILAEMRFEGKLMLLTGIDRYTLKIRTYSAIFQEMTKNKDGWSRGDCEVLKRRLL